MSLINDALKKAQRMRQEQETAKAAGATDIAPGERRTGLSMQWLIVLGAAAAVLVVLSVVGTVFWVNREPPKPASPLAALKAPPAAPAKPGEPNGAVMPPATKTESLPAPAAATSAPIQSAQTAITPGSTPAPNVAITVPAPAPPNPTAGGGATAGTTPAPDPATLFRERVATPAPPATPPPPILPQPNPRIQDYVDAIKLSMVRAAGADSRVMMNDHVYRLNDFVDRTLGIKLVKVTSNQLTFADANGFTYTKSY